MQCALKLEIYLLCDYASPSELKNEFASNLNNIRENNKQSTDYYDGKSVIAIIIILSRNNFGFVLPSTNINIHIARVFFAQHEINLVQFITIIFRSPLE